MSWTTAYIKLLVSTPIYIVHSSHMPPTVATSRKNVRTWNQYGEMPGVEETHPKTPDNLETKKDNSQIKMLLKLAWKFSKKFLGVSKRL